jgi:hypothetical protein
MEIETSMSKNLTIFMNFEDVLGCENATAMFRILELDVTSPDFKIKQILSDFLDCSQFSCEQKIRWFLEDQNIPSLLSKIPELA